MVAQAVQDQTAQGLARGTVQRQLQIVFDLGGQEAGGGAAILPIGLFKRLAALAHIFGGQQGGDTQQHGRMILSRQYRVRAVSVNAKSPVGTVVHRAVTLACATSSAQAGQGAQYVNLSEATAERPAAMLA